MGWARGRGESDGGRLLWLGIWGVGERPALFWPFFVCLWEAWCYNMMMDVEIATMPHLERFRSLLSLEPTGGLHLGLWWRRWRAR